MITITKEEIIDIAVAELEKKNLGYTEEFLKIHEIGLENNIPAIEHVRILDDGTATVYFKVLEEVFYFAVSIDLEKRNARWSYSEDKVEISFNVDSETYSYDELTGMTILQPTWGWSKGDIIKQRPHPIEIARLGFQPNTEPDSLENKLKNLLDFLETDMTGVKQLISNAQAYFSTTIHTHNGNMHIGGIFLEPSILKKLAELNVSIDFDFYACGKFFKNSDDLKDDIIKR